jgi:predicted ferric reductase
MASISLELVRHSLSIVNPADQSGLAAIAPLAFLCLHSLPILRRKGYELFVMLHQPVAIIYVGMLFWHCRNALTSWQFLYATCVIWATAAISRFIFKLNWTKFRNYSWLVGDDASVTILPENAIKVTIPTQTKWKPGQYVYLRMPGVALLDNHPFTITSLCSDDLPSEYGDEYRDMILVFRPFGGFTKRVAELARNKGPGHVYRAFVDGPYGGLKRRLESFDKIILIAGGSGITALVSHLLDLIKRMRDGKAITRSIHVIWAMKRPDTLEWFKEELRICRECAPPETVKCQFFVTAAKRMNKGQMRLTNQAESHISTYFRDHINAAFEGMADKRASYMSKRNSAYIRDEADGDEQREMELRQENEDVISPLPRAHLTGSTVSPSTPHPSSLHIRNFSMPGANEPSQGSGNDTGATPLLEERPELPAPIAVPIPNMRPAGRNLALDIQTALQTVGSSSNHLGNRQSQPFFSADADAPTAISETANHFNFGFPSTPTEFQKNLMRFAFLPAAKAANDGWTTEYGRPDLPYMLKDLVNCAEIESENKRVCVFVCGPPSMRVTVSRTIAEMQRYVLDKSNGLDEIYMHTENYAL